jgi:phospholipase C
MRSLNYGVEGEREEMSLDHIIVLMLENNSFDRMLGGLFPPRPDPLSPGGGVKGAAAQYSNADQITGKTYAMAETTAREMPEDPGHDLSDVLPQISNHCSGFVNNFAAKYPNSVATERQEIMSFYADGALPVLQDLAKKFTVCDRWFSSMPGPTWPNRLFLYSGTSWGFTDMNALHYWDQPTLFDLLSNNGVPWKLYYGDVSSTYILVNEPDPSACASLRYFYQDAKGPEANFPKFSLIEPGYFGKTPSDQHPPHDVFRGEALIAEVYNALRANDALWQRSLLVVIYDEHGGFYDHIDPPASIAPDNRRDGSGFNFDRYGVRVPAVLISPWLDPGVITDTFDHTSLVKFILERSGLGSNGLGVRVSAATTQTIQSHLRQTPRDTSNVLPTVPVPNFFPPQEQQSLTDHQVALADMTRVLASQIKNPSVAVPLLRRSLDQSPEHEAQLAIDRFEAFLLDKAKS